jgi:hypothetical protein
MQTHHTSGKKFGYIFGGKTVQKNRSSGAILDHFPAIALIDSGCRGTAMSRNIGG